jgi:hypothetical protein
MTGAFLISYFSLKRQRVGKEAFFLSLCSLASGIWLYEIGYHYAYGPNLEQIILDASRIDFSGTSHGSYSVFPLLWSIMMILLPFAGYRFMRVNWFFFFAFVGGFVVFALWILLGFPQFFAPGYSSSFTGYRDVIVYPNSYRTLVGYLANSFSKLLVIAPALLFVPKASMTPTLTRIWRRIVRTVW